MSVKLILLVVHCLPYFMCDNNILNPDAAEVWQFVYVHISRDIHVKDEPVVYVVELTVSYGS